MSNEIGMNGWIGVGAAAGSVLGGKISALCQQFWIVVVLTSFHASLARHIPSS